jgi:hypothetical protein
MRSVAVMILLGMVGSASAQQEISERGPEDDGESYVSDQQIVEATMQRERARLQMLSDQGIMEDGGDIDKVITVFVTDESGEPLTSAQMDVRFYEGEKLTGSWSGIPASDAGKVSFYARGYFGGMRLEIWVISAKGFAPRRLKNYRKRDGADCQSTPLPEARSVHLVELFQRHATDWKWRRKYWYGRMRENDAGKSVAECIRHVVLTKPGSTSRQ